MDSPSKLRICMLLPDPYDPNMPARPAVREIYGEVFPVWGHRVVWIMPAKEKLKRVQQERFKDVPIYVIPRYTGSMLLVKILNKLSFVWREARLASRIIREQKCNIVQVRNGIFEGLLGVYLKTKHKVPLVFQYSFPIAEGNLERYKLGAGKLAYLMGKLQRFVTPYIMRRADLILPISKWMEEDLVRADIPRSKMLPLSLGVNTELFSPSVSCGKNISKRYNFSNTKIVVYAGVMDKARQLGVLVRAFGRVKQGKPNVKLLMVGDGDDRSTCEKLVHDLGLTEDVIFTGQVPYFEVPQFIAAADIGVSPVPPLDIYKVSSPCKLFEYMAMAKPVVANEEIPEHKEVLEQSGGGILVTFTSEAFADAIVELLDNPDKTAEMGRRGREWVMKNRSYEILARRIEQAYYQLLKER